MDRLEQIKQQIEFEEMWRELTSLRKWLPSEVLEYRWKTKPWLRMTSIALQDMVQRQYEEGVRHRLRTKEAVLGFLDKHQISYEEITPTALATQASPTL